MCGELREPFFGSHNSAHFYWGVRETQLSFLDRRSLKSTLLSEWLCVQHACVPCLVLNYRARLWHASCLCATKFCTRLFGPLNCVYKLSLSILSSFYEWKIHFAYRVREAAELRSSSLFLAPARSYWWPERRRVFLTFVFWLSFFTADISADIFMTAQEASAKCVYAFM